MTAGGLPSIHRISTGSTVNNIRCSHSRFKPIKDPAKNPPSAVFQLSSFSRRFADASLVNSYVPPIAAVELSAQLCNKSKTVVQRTEDSDCASSPCEDPPSAHIPLGQSILNCGNEGTGRTRDQGALDTSLDGILRMVCMVPGCHIDCCGRRSWN